MIPTLTPFPTWAHATHVCSRRIHTGNGPITAFPSSSCRLNNKTLPKKNWSSCDKRKDEGKTAVVGTDRTGADGTGMAELIWRNWYGGIDIAELIWRNCYGRIDMAELVWRNWYGGIGMAELIWWN
jgi:hypothetical protein